MFRTLFFLICTMSIMHAGWLDAWYASKAKEAYTQGDYSKASSLYQHLDQTHDTAAYNLGNAYYKEKAYEKALEAYQHVKEPSLLPQTLHNIGNAYAQLHQNDKAIVAYESALKLKEDKDTRFNLELLKKEQKQKQNKPSDANQKQDNSQKSSSKEQQPKDANASNSSNNAEPQQSDKPSQNEPKNTQDANASTQQQHPTPSKPEEKPSPDTHDAQKQDAPKEADTKGKQNAQAVQPDDSNAPISNHEERQWDKILNLRGVNTLMLPLSNKGEKDDTSKPW